MAEKKYVVKRGSIFDKAGREIPVGTVISLTPQAAESLRNKVERYVKPDEPEEPAELPAPAPAPAPDEQEEPHRTPARRRRRG